LKTPQVRPGRRTLPIEPARRFVERYLPAWHPGDSAPVRIARLRLIVLVMLVALAVGVLVLTVVVVVVESRVLRNADAGDCLALDEAKNSYIRVSCADSSAAFRVFGVRDDPKACVDVPGASRLYSDWSGSYCIGAKEVDPATTINGIAVGECVRFTDDKPIRSPCSEGAFPVLGVVHDVPSHIGADNDYLGDICIDRGINKVRRTYAWGIITDADAGSWDRLLCLGRATE
jgi:hypothetical protein